MYFDFVKRLKCPALSNLSASGGRDEWKPDTKIQGPGSVLIRLILSFDVTCVIWVLFTPKAFQTGSWEP